MTLSSAISEVTWVGPLSAVPSKGVECTWGTQQQTKVGQLGQGNAVAENYIDHVLS